MTSFLITARLLNHCFKVRDVAVKYKPCHFTQIRIFSCQKLSLLQANFWSWWHRTLRWKWRRMIISLSHGWKNAWLMLLYSRSTLSPRTDMKRKPEKKTHLICVPTEKLYKIQALRFKRRVYGVYLTSGMTLKVTHWQLWQSRLSIGLL